MLDNANGFSSSIFLISVSNRNFAYEAKAYTPLYPRLSCKRVVDFQTILEHLPVLQVF